MNGDLNIWARTFADPPPSSGGAQAVYSPNGDYLGFRSQDGIFWPQPGASQISPQVATQPEQNKPADKPKCDPLYAFFIAGDDCVFDPVGAPLAAAGDAAGGAITWVFDQPWAKALVVVVIGVLFLWAGLQGLIKSNG